MDTPIPQPVVAPLTRAAIFLVVTLSPDKAQQATVRDFCGDFSGLVRAVAFRDLEGYLSCVVGFGSSAWDQLVPTRRPAGLHPFREVRAGSRHAVSTPATCCSTFAQRDWISASSSRLSSQRGWVGQWHPLTRSMASSTSTIAT